MGVRSVMSLFFVCCLVPVSIVISLRSCGEYSVPPPLNADLMAAVGELTSCVVSTDKLVAVFIAFFCYVSAGVGEPA